jgi:hypothetical protein
LNTIALRIKFSTCELQENAYKSEQCPKACLATVGTEYILVLCYNIPFTDTYFIFNF